ncbi:hypothetical protein PVK06_027821 [Gossypium arboreum]|uniref:Uncharacterized protein n=1 Tax=Gossypium arboreum TaxID=29729 RepID=A0ABR0P1S3_GOSAR|nr:hypothetical protein PVK06_027821 [Gossypium arboreum]
MHAGKQVKEDSSDVRISGYNKAGRYFRGKMEDDPPESLRLGRQIESPLDDPDEILYRCGDFDWFYLLGI